MLLRFDVPSFQEKHWMEAQLAVNNRWFSSVNVMVSLYPLPPPLLHVHVAESLPEVSVVLCCLRWCSKVQPVWLMYIPGNVTHCTWYTTHGLCEGGWGLLDIDFKWCQNSPYYLWYMSHILMDYHYFGPVWSKRLYWTLASVVSLESACQLCDYLQLQEIIHLWLC